MNPRFYVKINPNFKFNKISLNNQTGFNSKSNPKKIFYNFNDYISYKVNSESNKNNNIKHKLFEKDFYQYKKHLFGLFNNKIDKNLSPLSLEKRNSDVHSLRAKLLHHNNKLQRIDFNINVTDSNKEKNELKLKIKHYLSQININNKISRNADNHNIFNNYRSEEAKNNSDKNLLKKMEESKINKSHFSIKSDKICLPCITTNVIRKRNNIKILMKKMDKNKYNYNSKKTIDGRRNEFDILKSINHFMDNREYTIKMNEIKRNSEIYEYVGNNDKELFSDSINNKKENENSQETDINNELLKRKEDDKYMIYESSKKYIDTDKIYNSGKFVLANIPNVSLDKSFKNIKTLESNILNIKNENLDTPFCIRKSKY